MKKNQIFLLLFALSSLFVVSCSPKYFNETQQGNMFLRNNKVYFQKQFNHPVSFSSAKEGMKSFNTPNGGFQVKLEDDNTLNGVMVNYHLNWMITDDKKFKVPPIYKKPMNASFEIEKNQGTYTVTVTNIWIAAPPKSKQTNVTLESLMIAKDGCCFLKSKQKLKVLELIDKNFSKIFLSTAAGGDLRF